MTKPSVPPQFDPNFYSKVTLNDLVIYAVHSLHKQGREVKSEDVIAACFALFPKRFLLKKYPQYPDSGIVSRRWSECKRKGYLRGNALKGFQITARGIKRAEKVEKLLGKPMKPVRVLKQKVEKPVTVSVIPAKVEKPKAEKPVAVPVETIHPELKRHAGKYVRSIENSDAYRRYRKNLPLNEFDFRSLLLCTMESSPTALARNLNQFKEYVNIHDRKDLFAFLEFCEGKFSSLLGMAKSKK